MNAKNTTTQHPSPRRNWLGAGIALAVVALAALGIAWQVDDLLADPDPPPIDPAAARARAWERAGPLLAGADRRAASALDKHLAAIPAFLAERKPGTRAFAEQLLGLRGKWELVKGQLAADGEQDYARFLEGAFAEHVFRADELRQVVESAVRGYLAELEGIEADLLVRLRADLSQDELLPLQEVIPALRSDEALARHYRELAGRLARELNADLAVVAGRELVIWEATAIATELTIQAGAAVAGRLGVSAGIVAAGAASSWATLGVGLVVAIVVDAAINQIIKAAGYDAEERVAERVGQTLDALGRAITDGDPQARGALARGLRGELSKIAAARASLRQEALRRLIHDTEVTP